MDNPWYVVTKLLIIHDTFLHQCTLALLLKLTLQKVSYSNISMTSNKKMTKNMRWPQIWGEAQKRRLTQL